MRYSAIGQWLTAHTEYAPELLDGPEVEHVINKRMRDAGSVDETTYLTALRTNEDELERLLASVAVPETSFFRYPKSFEMLARWLEHRRQTTRGAAELRMLSLACATGEEPCSMAMTAAHAGWAHSDVRIDAVDRSARAIERARSGRYPANAIGSVPLWATASFTSGDREVQVDPHLLDVVHYRHANALALPVPARPGYDVIFCRNLLIYLAPVPRSRLAAWLKRSLADDGLLFVGHAETGAYLDGAFVAAEAQRAFAFAPAPAPAPPPSQPPAPGRAAAVEPARRTRRAGRPRTPSPRPVAVPRTDPPPAPPAASNLDDARALADRGDLRSALDMARTVLDSHGPAPAVFELLGSVLLALGEVQEAHDSFFRAVYLEPTREASLLQLAFIAEQRGDMEEAARYRRRARSALHTP